MEKLGIDPILIGIQVANFFVLLFLLKKYLYKPVLEMLDKRKNSVEQAEQLRQEMEKQKSARDEEHKQVIDNAKKEAEQLLDEVKQQGETIKKQLQSEAKEKAERIVSKAEAEAQQKEESIRQELANEVKKSAVESAELVLSQQLTDEQKQAILQQAVQRFGN